MPLVIISLQSKELQIKKQYNDTVKIQTRQYKALQKHMVASLPAERKKEILKQSKEEQLRKIAMLAMQYERTITDMAQQQTVSVFYGTLISLCVRVYVSILYYVTLIMHTLSLGCALSLQVKLDEAQVAEQNALRKQLHQEQELLQRFQESQEEKLKAQHSREKTALDIKVEMSMKELDKQVCLLFV